jgi:hypothetical protein
VSVVTNSEVTFTFVKSYKNVQVTEEYTCVGDLEVFIGSIDCR